MCNIDEQELDGTLDDLFERVAALEKKMRFLTSQIEELSGE